MSRKQIEVGGSHQELGNYSHVVHDGRGTFYISGQGPVDTTGALVGADDATAQTRQVMQNIVAAVEAAGLTSDAVVRMTVYLVDRTVVPAFVAARTDFFSAPFPASTVVIVSGLIDEDWKLEIDAVAVSE
jgi:enamine deaminase RidA (YjgF/YER057c/UK114 family)